MIEYYIINSANDLLNELSVFEDSDDEDYVDPNEQDQQYYEVFDENKIEQTPMPSQVNRTHDNTCLICLSDENIVDFSD